MKCGDCRYWARLPSEDNIGTCEDGMTDHPDFYASGDAGPFTVGVDDITTPEDFFCAAFKKRGDNGERY